MVPASALHARRRLFGALAEGLRVRFEPVGEGSSVDGLDAVVAFGAADTRAAGPLLRFEASSEDGAASIHFSVSPRLDRRLRGRTLAKDAGPVHGLEAEEGDEVLATAGGRPVWLKRGRDTDLVAGVPDELGPGEFLRDRVSPGRIMPMLPLVHFVREVAADGWRPPAPRAAFVVDDPNLHWRSYGYLDYPALARHARQHAYHIVMAMVPLDAWFADPRAVRVFRDNADVLSLCVHGNDHRRHDLEQPRTREEALRTLSSAVRRITKFERRTGLPVSRVMVPPHEACSPATMAAMVEMGFEAACATRPYLWVDFGTPPSPYNSPWPEDHLLCGWYMTELMENGFPVMLRREFHEHDDAVLRAFFDQPIILYGHADDFAEGLDPLERAAAVVNSFDASWLPLSDLAAANFESRGQNGTLRLRPFARRVRVEVDPGVSEVILEPPGWVDGFGHGVEATFAGAAAEVQQGVVRLPVERDTAGPLEVRWKPAREVAHDSVRGLRPGGGTLARRLLSEARDRIQPLTN